MISILPSRDDPVVASGSEVAGGPAGTRVLVGLTWWTVYRVLIAMTAAAAVLGYLSKYYCLINGWGAGKYTHMCYTDIAPLYQLRGLADGAIPYVTDLPQDQVLEYPALTGVFVWIAARMTPSGNTAWFFHVNVLLLLVCWIVAVLATAVAQRSRPWDAAMVALAPGIILSGTVNWDLLPVALVAVSVAFWARNHPWWAGVFLGLAIAAKFYPLLILGPMFLLAWRARAWGAFAKYLAGTVVAWLLVNVPFMVINFDGWSRFYLFSQERGEDFGSVWLVLTTAGRQVPPDVLNSAGYRAVAARGRRNSAAHLARSCDAASRSGAVPGRRGVPAHEQGLLTAVRGMADPAGGPGPAPVARPAHMAGGRSGVLRVDLAVPRRP